MSGYCRWSLLYSAILRSRADSLPSCCMWFWMSDQPFVASFEYPPPWCTYSAVRLIYGRYHVKLLPSRRVLCTPCNLSPCHVTSCKSHIGRVHACLAVTCHLHFWQNDGDLLLRQHGGGKDTEIRVSTEGWPRSPKFSGSTCRDSNPGPFNHEFCALAT